MATTEIYLNQLGKVVRKNDKYRLVVEGDFYRLYRISRELIWAADYSCTVGKRKVAIPVGYVSNPDNFEYAIDAAEEEMRCLMAEGI
jgi:hypothetical protein